jgi:predicted nicotinamide N-methyase
MSSPRVRYQTIEFGKIDIHLHTLRDRQQYDDPEGIAESLGISSALWPIFGIIWPSGFILANFMLDYDFQDKRILEVGCGIGLSSLLLNHLLADITATDYHPAVEGFLDKNALLNNDRKIPFVLADWKDINPELGKFDLIIASDLLYEDEHAVLLSRFIERHAGSHCDVVMVDAGRGRHGKFCRQMTLLGFSHEKSKPLETGFLDKSFSGNIIEYHR